MAYDTRIYRYDFRGSNIIQATNVGGPWVKADTSSAGSPTLQGVSAVGDA